MLMTAKIINIKNERIVFMKEDVTRMIGVLIKRCTGVIVIGLV